MIFTLENITILRDGQIVLKDLSWQLKSGEHWFILGQNGSGKSTLLELMMGTLWPDEGQVSFLGEIYGETEILKLREKMGLVSAWIQNRIGDTIKVEHLVASGLVGTIGLFETYTDLMRRKVNSVLKRLGVFSLRWKLFGHLSSGEQMKVLLARALVHSPRVLILDEPFSHLDILSRVQFYRQVENLVKKNKKLQVVLVTHHLADVLPLFTHGLVLKNGKALFSGKRKQAMSDAVLQTAYDLQKYELKYLKK